MKVSSLQILSWREQWELTAETDIGNNNRRALANFSGIIKTKSLNLRA